MVKKKKKKNQQVIERVSIQTRNNILFISHVDKLKPLVLVPVFLIHACTGFRRLKGEGKGQFSCLKLVDRRDLFSLKS